MLRSAGPWDSAGDYPRRRAHRLRQPARAGAGRLRRAGLRVRGRGHLDRGGQRGQRRCSCSRSRRRAAPACGTRSCRRSPQEVAKAGGQSAEQDGPFGPELLAMVVPQGAEASGHPAAAAAVHRRRRPALVPARPDQRPGGDRRRAGRAVRGRSSPMWSWSAATTRSRRASHWTSGCRTRPRQVLESQLAGRAEPDLLNPFERGPGDHRDPLGWRRAAAALAAVSCAASRLASSRSTFWLVTNSSSSPASSGSSRARAR